MFLDLADPDCSFSYSKLMEAHRSRFFEQIFDTSAEPARIIGDYMNYHDVIFQDQRDHFNKRLAQDLGPGFPANGILGPDDRIDEGFLQARFPSLTGAYPLAKDHGHFEHVTLLPESENELRYEGLPQPLNQRSWRPTRGEFSAFICRGVSLFAGPHQYALLDAGGEDYYPACSLRIYSKSVKDHPRVQVKGPVVLVQDHGDGSNFAHFTFDWVTRIMHCLESGLVEPKNARFVLGGSYGQYQRTLVSVLINLYGLTAENFLFPQEKAIVDIDGDFIFFSDQDLAVLHPAQMCHPKSVDLLRRLARGVESDTGSVERVFISRSDANLRRITNEEELIAIAEARGFQTFRLGELSIQDQFSLIRGARQIVGAHGMGFTHLFLSEAAPAILELFHPIFGTDAYCMITRAMGGKYNFMVGDDLADGRASYSVDPAAFSRRLDEL